jgi:ABC-type glycerol-3-phosphate transport system substrate-binding protein
MKSTTAAVAVLAAALVAVFCVGSAAADDKMNKYYKQGLTLVHFSAQLEPSHTKTPYTP